MPRSNDEFLNGAWKKENPGYGSEYFLGNGESPTGRQKGAVLSVKHPELEYRDYTDYDNAWDKDAWANRNRIGFDEQLPLFTQKEKPAVIKIGAAPDDPQKFLDLAVRAHEDMQKLRPGSELWASDSLSDYSGPLANHGLDLGIIHGIEGKAKGERWTPSDSNGIDKDDGRDWIDSQSQKVQRALDNGGAGINTLDPVELEANKRKFVSDFSRSRREAHTTPAIPEFNQGSTFDSTTPIPVQNALPGMELEKQQLGITPVNVQQPDAFEMARHQQMKATQPSAKQVETALRNSANAVAATNNRYE